MENNKKNHGDGLKELFSGLERDVLAAEAKADIMTRIHEMDLKLKKGKENRLEWILFAVFAFLVGSIIAAVRYFWWGGNREVGVVRNTDGLFDDIPAYSGEIQHSFELPKFPEISLPDISIPPVFIFLALCGLLLLFFDRFIRKRYNKKHSAEM